MAAKYNYFGLTYQDIIDAFPGTILEDFGSSAINAQKIINDELDRQEEMLVTHMNRRINRMWPYVRYELVCKEAYEGQTVITFGLPVDFTAPNNYVWVVSGRSPLYGGLSYASIDVLPEINALQYTPSVAWVSGANNTAVLSAPLHQWDTVYATYNVDLTQLNLPSLKNILRNMVCANIGYMLYTKGHDKWDYVERFNTNAQAGISDLKNPDYLPAELMKLRFLYNIDSEFKPIKGYRSN